MNFSPTGDRPRRGATLIEVMVAALILATLALAGGAILYRSRALLYHERNLRSATDIATSRLEALRAAPFAQLEPDDGGDGFPSLSNGVWVLLGADPMEQIGRHGHVFSVTTTVTSEPPYDRRLVRATVSVADTDDPENRVTLETRLAP